MSDRGLAFNLIGGPSWGLRTGVSSTRRNDRKEGLRPSSVKLRGLQQADRSVRMSSGEGPASAGHRRMAKGRQHQLEIVLLSLAHRHSVIRSGLNR